MYEIHRQGVLNEWSNIPRSYFPAKLYNCLNCWTENSQDYVCAAPDLKHQLYTLIAVLAWGIRH